jgi:hypothetical protein
MNSILRSICSFVIRATYELFGVGVMVNVHAVWLILAVIPGEQKKNLLLNLSQTRLTILDEG